MEIAEAKKIRRHFRIAFALMIIFIVVSIGTRVAHGYVREALYQDNIQISTASDDETRIQAYRQAISLDPSRPQAYALMLDVYSADGVFAKQESEAFLSVYNRNLRRIDSSGTAYSDLQRKIGFLYINGYDGPTTTRLRMGIPFLDTAMELMDPEDPNYVAVDCYCHIGAYYEDYIWNASAVQEVSQETMTALVADISETLPKFLTDSAASSLYNRLGFSIAVCDLFLDQRAILAVTVAEDQVMDILDRIYMDLPMEDSIQQEQTKQMLEALKKNKANYYDMIRRAYSREGV